VSKGEPLYRLLGDQPATTDRCRSTADERFCPPYDSNLIVDADFAQQRLLPVSPATRDKGWRASPLDGAPGAGIAASTAAVPRPHVRLGWMAHDEQVSQPPAAGQKIVLAQEIKSARGGQYTFKLRAQGGGSSREAFDRWFQAALECRLVLFRFASSNKNPLEMTELASRPFRPTFAAGQDDTPQEFGLSEFLGSTVPGTNFPIGNGLGIAVIVQCRTPLAVVPGESAFVQLHSVTLEFDARPRDENVVV
jgi:hypothetical protein